MRYRVTGFGIRVKCFRFRDLGIRVQGPGSRV